MTDFVALHPVAQLRHYEDRFKPLPCKLPAGQLVADPAFLNAAA